MASSWLTKETLMEVVVEQLHNTGSLLKVHIFSGSFGSAVERKGTKRTRNNLLYLVARLARQWMTKEQTSQTSRLVRWMVKSGPVFCSLARVKPWLFAFPTELFFLSDKIILRNKSCWSLQGFLLSLVITPV